jgi:hypothetical protein
MRTLLLCSALAAVSGCASKGRSIPEIEPIADAGTEEEAADCSEVCGGDWAPPDGGCLQGGCPGIESEQCGGTWYDCCGDCSFPGPDGSSHEGL